MSDALIDRLTDNERECLERVLDHQTAKEMARDLGISHHAVEKRLKRAREKLGAATSLEAARRYGETVSGSSDLAPSRQQALSNLQPTDIQDRRRRRKSIMVFSTIIAGVAAIGLAVTWGDNGSETNAAANLEDTARQVSFDAVADRNRYRIEMAPVDGVDPYDIGFKVTDSDGSNGISVGEFLEGARKFDYAGYMASGAENGSLTKIFQRLDNDGNGLIERSEYRNIKFTDEKGEAFLFEIVIAGGRAAESEPHKYTNRVESTLTPEPKPQFDRLDRDRSGWLDVSEFTVTVSGSIGANPLSAQRAIQEFFAATDRNGDGLIDRQEFRDRRESDNVRVIMLDLPEAAAQKGSTRSPQDGGPPRGRGPVRPVGP